MGGTVIFDPLRSKVYFQYLFYKMGVLGVLVGKTGEWDAMDKTLRQDAIREMNEKCEKIFHYVCKHHRCRFWLKQGKMPNSS